MHQITADLFLLASRGRLDSTSGTLMRVFGTPRESQKSSSVLRQPLAEMIDFGSCTHRSPATLCRSRLETDAVLNRSIQRLCSTMPYTGWGCGRACNSCCIRVGCRVIYQIMRPRKHVSCKVPCVSCHPLPAPKMSIGTLFATYHW